MVDVSKLLSNKFFEQPLRNYFDNHNLRVIKCESVKAIPVGENYTSDIFRTTITYTRENSDRQETISVIAKCFPNNEMILGLVKEFRSFETEANVYNTVLPAINSTLEKSEQLSAKCIHYEKGENQIIVFEDLSVMKFKMHPRQQGLDLQHCLLVVDKLACLHAASLVLYNKDPSSINQYRIGLFYENPFTRHWTVTGLNALIAACSNWSGFERYGKKIEAIKDQAYQRLQDSKVLKKFNVLNHGDCWINNIMFLYDDDGNVKDLRFVDFQIIFYGSPTIDLMYFWTTSPNMEVRLDHFDTIINHYYNKLKDVLTRMNYPLENVLSKEELLQDFHSRAFYGLAASLTVLPIVAATTRDDATLEEMVHGRDDGFRYDSYNNERYRKYMQYLLPYFDKQGILD